MNLVSCVNISAPVEEYFDHIDDSLFDREEQRSHIVLTETLSEFRCGESSSNLNAYPNNDSPRHSSQSKRTH